jgi:hypothetical protein
MGMESVHFISRYFFFGWFRTCDLWYSSVKKIQNDFLMKKGIIITLVLGLVLLPEVSYACATCFGNPNAAATQGMNKAIIAMLGVTGTVLGGFGSSIYVLNRRARRYAKSLKRKKLIQR